MKKLIFLLILLFASPCFATNYYVDTSCGDNGDGTWDSSGDGCDDNGGGTDGAWNDLRDAMQLATFNAGDKIWIRRTSSHDEGVENDNADIAPADDGDPDNHLYFIGYPRASKSINCDWVNGSSTVDNVDSNDMDREQHVGRFITGPDGFDYLITYITDSNTFVIDREYAGSTSANEDVSIKADEDYTEAAALEGGEVLADWGGDADDIPVIDFNDEAYNLNFINTTHITIKNIEIKDSSDTNGIIYTHNSAVGLAFVNCLIKQNTQNTEIATFASSALVIDQCIFEGFGGANASVTVKTDVYAEAVISNSAIYNSGDNGLWVRSASLKLYNVNIGVEAANSDDDIMVQKFHSISGRDVKLGGSNGLVAISTSPGQTSSIEIGNYGKVLNTHRTFFPGVIADKSAVSGETPNKKISDDVIELTFSSGFDFVDTDMMPIVYTYYVTQSTGSQNYKIWIYNDTGDTINDDTDTDDICMRCRYVAGYDDTSEYVWEEVWSDEIDIADAADADDWDYLQCDSINPATSSTVICEIMASRYDAGDTGNIYIDPDMQHP